VCHSGFANVACMAMLDVGRLIYSYVIVLPFVYNYVDCCVYV
jgi:hypothetical protein